MTQSKPKIWKEKLMWKTSYNLKDEKIRTEYERKINEKVDKWTIEQLEYKINRLIDKNDPDNCSKR